MNPHAQANAVGVLVFPIADQYLRRQSIHDIEAVEPAQRPSASTTSKPISPALRHAPAAHCRQGHRGPGPRPMQPPCPLLIPQLAHTVSVQTIELPRHALEFGGVLLLLLIKQTVFDGHGDIARNSAENLDVL